MAPLPTIADVYRVTLLWNGISGVTPRNVLHLRCPLGDEDDVRAALVASAASLASNSHPFHILPGGYECDAIDIIKLDGSSATQHFTTNNLFVGGRAVGGDFNPAVAAVVSLHTAQRGPRGRGRVYAGPCAEDSQAAGVLSTTSSGLMATAWNGLRVALGNQSPPAPLVVASYVHADSHLVTTTGIAPLVGTQRRRQDQLR